MKYEDEINLMLPLNDEQNTDFFHTRQSSVFQHTNHPYLGLVVVIHICVGRNTGAVLVSKDMDNRLWRANI